MNRPRLIPGRPPLGTTAALALVAALALLAPPLAAADLPGDAVPHRMNGPEPRDGTVDLQLEEIWRRGGEDDEEVLLGIVTKVMTDAEGRLYVLDAQLSQISVFSPEGELEQVLGRQGSGPGEFQNAQQMTFLPGGDAIGVAQMFPGKLVGINLDGSPAGDITIGDAASGGFAVLINAACGGDNLVVSGLEISVDQAAATMDRHHFVRSYDRAGKLLVEYLAKDVQWVFDAGFTLREQEADFVWWRLGVDPEGRVVVGEPREDYLLSVYAPDGRLERTFGREYESWRRDERIHARFETMMEAQTRQLPPGTESEVAELEQDIWGVHCAADGSYWIVSSRGMYAPPAGVFTVWDVFSSEGEYLRQVQARVPGRPGTDLLFMTDHGYAVMVTGFWDAALAAMGVGQDEEAQAMEIICYRVL